MHVIQPLRLKGMSQPFRDAAPKVADLWPDAYAAPVEISLIFHMTVGAWLPEGAVRMFLPPEQHAPTLAATPLPVDSFPQLYIELGS